MASVDTEYVVRLTYAELYNEELKDLLASSPSSEGLKIIDDPQLGPLIHNITEVNFTTAIEMQQLLEEGENRRHFGVTNMNAHSSRSHVLVRLSIEGRKVSTKSNNPLRPSWGKDKPNFVSTLNLVDLAGSERANKSGTTGQSLKEGSFINKSLLTLGTVIANLSEGKIGSHIPYRDSKLTRLLSSALGGNSKTSMITCISPASGNIIESLITLRFASRAKLIVNKISKNEILSVKALSQKLAIANIEIDNMKQKLELSKQMGFIIEDDDEYGNNNNNGKQKITLKEKALFISRNMRNLKYLIKNTPILIKNLRNLGLINIIKKIQNDIKIAISNQKDLNEIIDDHMSIITTYLPNNYNIITKIQLLIEQNESDYIYGDHINDLEVTDLNDNDDDFFNSNIEEYNEKTENLLFYNEDIRTIAVYTINNLKNDIILNNQNELKLKNNNNDLNTIINNYEEKIKLLNKLVANNAEFRELLNNNEINNNNIINNLNNNIDEIKNNNNNLINKNNILENQLNEKETILTSKEHEIIQFHAEINRLKTNIDTLNTDLSTISSSKTLLEEEFSRQRIDMRIQMEKMRGNMHTMLQHGGDQVKVLENQLELQEKEIENLKDYLEEETKSKERLEIELSHLRSNIVLLQDEQRVHISEMNVCRKEVRRYSSGSSIISVEL